VVRDFLNFRVNQNSQVTDASVRKMEYCAIVGAIALDHVITNLKKQIGKLVPKE
jgi:hypothetical protein